MKIKLLNKISWKYLFQYPISSNSPYRVNQDAFIELTAKQVQGKIIEIGAENQYNHGRFFKPENDYFPTNISMEGDNYLDATDMKYSNDSVDNYLCVSVLEHIREIRASIDEIQRTLKPGGKLFLVVPFGYAVHDKKDYWRMAPDAFIELFDKMEICEFYSLGDSLSSCAVALQRPKRKINLRYFILKNLGFICLLLSKFFGQADPFPSAYGLILKKK